MSRHRLKYFPTPEGLAAKSKLINDYLRAMARNGVSLTDIICLFMCTCAFVAWTGAAGDQSLPSAKIVFGLFRIVCLFAGISLIKLLSLNRSWLSEFPIKFLFGYFLVNSSIYFLKFAMGIDVRTAFVLLSLIILAIPIFDFIASLLFDRFLGA